MSRHAAGSGVQIPAPCPGDDERLAMHISGMRVYELKDLCRNVGLTSSGRKQDLVDRLRQFYSVRFENRLYLEILVIQILVLKVLLESPGVTMQHLMMAIKSGAVPWDQVEASIILYRQIPSHERIVRTENITDPMPHIPSTNYSSQSVHISAMMDPSSDFYNGPTPLFRNTLFYSLRGSVGAVQVLRASKGRASKSFILSIPTRHIAALESQTRFKLYLFCCVENSDVGRGTFLQYPPTEIYVENVLTRQSVRGIKGKPGTARPADLTPYITRFSSPFSVRVIYSDAADRYLVAAHVVEVNTPSSLMKQIENKPHISLESTRRAIREENALDEDIEVGNVPLSLRCPVTYARIQYPVKSIQCDHVQTFDGVSFLMMQERIPAWQCPVCSKTVNQNSLAVSDYLKDILDNTSEDIESVLLNTDGSWTPVRDTDEPEKKHEAKPKQNAADQDYKSTIKTQPADENIEIIDLDSDSDVEKGPQLQNSVPRSGLLDSETAEVSMNSPPPSDHSPPMGMLIDLGAEVLARASGSDRTQQDSDDDEETITVRNRRKRARLSLDSEIITEKSVTEFSSPASNAGDDTMEKSNKAISPEPEVPSSNSDSNSNSEQDAGSAASFLDDIPISQYRAISLSKSWKIPRENHGRNAGLASNSRPQSAPQATSLMRSTSQENSRQENIPLPVNGPAKKTHISEIIPSTETHRGCEIAKQMKSASISNDTASPAASKVGSGSSITQISPKQSNVIEKAVERERQAVVNPSEKSVTNEEANGKNSSLLPHKNNDDRSHPHTETHTPKNRAQPESILKNTQPSRVTPAGQSLKSKDITHNPVGFHNGDSENTSPTSREHSSVSGVDVSIPVVWQNKENHSKGVERVSQSLATSVNSMSTRETCLPQTQNKSMLIKPTINSQSLNTPATQDMANSATSKTYSTENPGKPKADFPLPTGESINASPAHHEKTVSVTSSNSSIKPLNEASSGTNKSKTGLETFEYPAKGNLKVVHSPQDLSPHLDRPKSTSSVSSHNSVQSQPNKNTIGKSVGDSNHARESSSQDQRNMTKNGQNPSHEVKTNKTDLPNYREISFKEQETMIGANARSLTNDPSAYSRARQEYMNSQAKQQHVRSYAGTNQSGVALTTTTGPPYDSHSSMRERQPNMDRNQSAYQAMIQARQAEMRGSIYQQNVRWSLDRINAYQRALSEMYSDGMGSHPLLRNGVTHASVPFQQQVNSNGPLEQYYFGNNAPPRETYMFRPGIDQIQSLGRSNPHIHPQTSISGPPTSSLQFSTRNNDSIPGASTIPESMSAETGRSSVDQNCASISSKTAVNNIIGNGSSEKTVKGILGIELSEEAFGRSREGLPLRRSRDELSTTASASNPNATTTVSPLNSRIQEMIIDAPGGQKRSLSGEPAQVRASNTRMNRQGSVRARFDPREITRSELIELDD